MVKRSCGSLILLTLMVIGMIVDVHGQAHPVPQDLSISVERTSRGVYHIQTSFRGSHSGRTMITLPSEWGGQTNLYSAIHNLSAKSSGKTKIDVTDEPNVKLVHHDSGDVVTVSYDLVQDFEGLLNNAIRYRPVTDSEYFHWIGHTVWVLPKWDDEQKVNARFDWRGFPKEWALASSDSVKKSRYTVRTTLGELKRTINVGGDFRLVSQTVGGQPVHFAVRGTWSFRDEELARMAARVIDGQRRFWDDRSQKYYLITLVPIYEGPGAYSFGGTGLRDSFALFATPNATVERLRSLIAHEYFHNWNPVRLGRMPADEASLYWFSEGFTEYFCNELLRRDGVFTEDEYRSRVNELIREYYTSPERESLNERIATQFWQNDAVQRLPYLRGFMLALNWNAAIVAESNGRHSLDDVMRDLLASAEGGKRELSALIVAEHLHRYLNNDVGNEIAGFVERGEHVTPHATAVPGSALIETELPVFDLGFDLPAFQNTKEISGVSDGSAAHRAGLRNGQKIVGGFSIALGDTEKEVAFRVTDGTTEIDLKYLPVARTPITIPQFVASN